MYSVNNDNTVTITAYKGNGGNIIIPSEIEEKPVIVIGSSAFKDCTNLIDIKIPDSVITISHNAFSHCTELTKK